MTLQNDVLNPGPVLNQHPRKAWKSMTSRGGRPCCGGVPLSATKNASDWQRSSKRLITLGLLIFLPFLMISRDRFWIFLERSQKLLLNALVRTMLCNSFIYFLYIVCLCILYYSIVFYCILFYYILRYSFCSKFTPAHGLFHEPKHRRYSSLRGCLNIFCRLLLRSGLQNVVEVQPVFSDMSIPWTSYMCSYVFLCLNFKIFQHDHCVVSFAFLCIS